MKSEMPGSLGEFETLVLIALARQGSDAYGVSICSDIAERTGRDVSLGAVYKTLERLETKGLLRSWVGEPTAQRGGRRRKFYALRPAGETALRQAYRAFTAMAGGFEARLEVK